MDFTEKQHNRALRTQAAGGPTPVTNADILDTGEIEGGENLKETI